MQRLRLSRNFFVASIKNRRNPLWVGMSLGLLLWALGCATSGQKSQNPLVGEVPAHRISVMSYNVENFFDAIHDKDRDDFTFLPLSAKKGNPEAQASCAKSKGYHQKECLTLDWTEAVVQKKIRHVSNSILQVYGKGPDILILDEVENLSVLNRLNSEGLAAAGYQTVVLIEGDDMRGIDVGFLSRFPLAGEPKLHHVIYSPPKDPNRNPWGTRGILQVPVKLPNGKTLYVFGVHFPAQMNPIEERFDAMKALTTAVAALPEGSSWIVGGDWNIPERENEESGILNQHIGKMGVMSHRIGCESCKGTHNFKGGWDFLDILVFSKDFVSPAGAQGYRVMNDRIMTPNFSPLQLNKNGRPAGFEADRDIGVSDHLPIFAELEEVL